MHRMIPFLALSLAACGLSSSKFDTKFEDKLCSEWEACNPDVSCDDSTGSTTFDTSACDFDKDAAKACLDGTWTCNTDNTAFPFVEMPADCASVYSNCGGGTGTGTETGTTSGSM